MNPDGLPELVRALRPAAMLYVGLTVVASIIVYVRPEPDRGLFEEVAIWGWAAGTVCVMPVVFAVLGVGSALWSNIGDPLLAQLTAPIRPDLVPVRHERKPDPVVDGSAIPRKVPLVASATPGTEHDDSTARSTVPEAPSATRNADDERQTND